MSDINIITSGLDAILLKPLEDQIKSTFEAKHKSLALLHSWDEIVYKDINRMFAFKQFDRKYRFICQNEQTLFQRLKNIKPSKLCHPQNRSSSSMNNNKSSLSCTSTPKSIPIKSNSKPSTKSSVNVITPNKETKSISAKHIESNLNPSEITQNQSTSIPTPMVTIKQSVTTTATTPSPATTSTVSSTNTVNYAQDNLARNQFNNNNNNKQNQYAQYAQYAQMNNTYNYNQKKSSNTATNYYAQYAQYAQFNQPQKQTPAQNPKYVQSMNGNNMNKMSHNNYAQYAQYAQYNNNYAQYNQQALWYPYPKNNNNKTMVNNNNKSMQNVNKNMNMNMNMNGKQNKGGQVYDNPTYYDASIQSSYQIKNGCYYYNPLNMNTNTSNDCYGEITEMMVGDENSQSSQGNISALSNTNSNSSSASLSNVTDNV